MKPELAWAIGCFHNGEYIGLVRYRYNGRPGEPILYRSREAARLGIEYPVSDYGDDARPVRVRVEFVP